MKFTASLLWRMALAVLTLVIASAFIAATAVAAVGLVGGLIVYVVVLILAGVVSPLISLVGGDITAGVDAFTSNLPLVMLVTGLALLPAWYLRPVRDEIRSFRKELGQVGSPASETHPEVAKLARQLAGQASIPEPTVYVADRFRPESYALGGRDDGTIVITKGLIKELTDEELKAVLAHEISHLVNGDSRIMGLSLIPMLVAEHVASSRRISVEVGMMIANIFYLIYLVVWAVLYAVTRVQRVFSQLGIAVLSRGRELAADRGAARLTGNPTALATALQTLDDARGRPDEDKRQWSQSASALDILPPKDSVFSEGPFRTHPSTEKRIEMLENLVVEQATEDVAESASV